MNISLLRLSINNVRITWLSSRLMTISTKKYKPIRICNTRCFKCSTWTSLCIIVLRTTKNIVKWICIINSKFIKLCKWKVWNKFPWFSIIKRFINTSISSNQQIVWITKFESQWMIVYMFITFIHNIKIFSPILWYLNFCIHQVYFIKYMRRRNKLLIVVRSCCSRNSIGHFFPTSTRISCLIDSPISSVSFDSSI